MTTLITAARETKHLLADKLEAAKTYERQLYNWHTTVPLYKKWIGNASHIVKMTLKIFKGPFQLIS